MVKLAVLFALLDITNTDSVAGAAFIVQLANTAKAAISPPRVASVLSAPTGGTKPCPAKDSVLGAKQENLVTSQ